MFRTDILRQMLASSWELFWLLIDIVILFIVPFGQTLFYGYFFNFWY